jgi:hypothetical protein
MLLSGGTLNAFVWIFRKAFAYGIPSSINTKYFSSEESGFQSWCADMWALNFALWNRNYVTQTTTQLDFSWATDSLKTFTEKPIFHNAGACMPADPLTGNIFYKGEWINRSPIGVDIPLPKEGSASRQYVLAIKEVKP